jgi:outer membrane protein TolC
MEEKNLLNIFKMLLLRSVCRFLLKMRHFIAVICTTVTLVLTTYCANATELIQLIDNALTSNYKIRSSEHELISSEYDRKKGLSPFYPVVNIQANTTWSDSTTKHPGANIPYLENEYNSNGYSLSISQTLIDYSKMYAYDEIKLEGEINLVKHNKIINDIIVNVVENYFSYLKYQAQQKATKAELLSSSIRLKQIKRNNNLGNVSKTDVYETFAQKEGNKRKVENIKKDIAISLRKLNSTTQTNTKPKFDIKLNLHFKQITLKRQETLKKTLSHTNYDIIIAKQGISKADSILGKSRSDFLPTLSASADYNYTDSNHAIPSHKNDISYGLKLTIPIMNGGSDVYEYKKNKNKMVQSQVNYEQTLDDAQVSFDELVIKVNNNVESIAILKSIVLSNYSVYEGTKKAYKIGTKTLTDLLKSESNLYNSIRDYYSNNYDYIINMTKLNALLGPIDLASIEKLSSSMVPLVYDFDIKVLDKFKQDWNE